MAKCNAASYYSVLQSLGYCNDAESEIDYRDFDDTEIMTEKPNCSCDSGDPGVIEQSIEGDDKTARKCDVASYYGMLQSLGYCDDDESEIDYRDFDDAKVITEKPTCACDRSDSGVTEQSIEGDDKTARKCDAAAYYSMLQSLGYCDDEESEIDYRDFDDTEIVTEKPTCGCDRSDSGATEQSMEVDDQTARKCDAAAYYSMLQSLGYCDDEEFEIDYRDFDDTEVVAEKPTCGCTLRVDEKATYGCDSSELDGAYTMARDSAVENRVGCCDNESKTDYRDFDDAKVVAEKPNCSCTPGSMDDSSCISKIGITHGNRKMEVNIVHDSCIEEKVVQEKTNCSCINKIDGKAGEGDIDSAETVDSPKLQHNYNKNIMSNLANFNEYKNYFYVNIKLMLFINNFYRHNCKARLDNTVFLWLYDCGRRAFCQQHFDMRRFYFCHNFKQKFTVKADFHCFQRAKGGIDFFCRLPQFSTYCR